MKLVRYWFYANFDPIVYEITSESATMIDYSIEEDERLQDIHSNMFNPLCPYDSWRSYVFFLQQKEEDEEVFTLP